MVALSPNQAAKSMAPRLTERQRLTYLADEIEFVLEMKDEAEDCKWIYQSLIQLVLEYQKQAGQWPEKGSKDDVRTWMTELKKLDPLREGRWLDLDSVLQSRLR
jgi:geranylgeranyl transferase type-2 subunit alpha